MPAEIILSTFLHSLWLGGVATMLAYLVLLFTSSTSASIRYNLLAGCLFLFVLAIGYVFFIEINAAYFQPISTSNTTDHLTVIGGTEGIVLGESIANRGIFGQFLYLLGWLNEQASTIIMLWFFIVCVKGIRFSFGLRNVHRMRYQDTVSAGTYWEDRVAQLARDLSIKDTVRIVQSALAQTPMVIGYFKPLILVPIGILNALPVEQVESIICHELAHIKRRDYLVNIIQSLLEILFFFNPAVLWISHLIKVERENCCDDLAVGKVSSRADYIRALVSCAEQSMQSPSLALNFSSNKNHLLKRVQRILSKEQNTVNRIEKAFLTLGIVSILLGSFAFQAFNAQKVAIPTPKKTFTFTGITADELTEEEGRNIEQTLEELANDMLADQLINNTDGLSFMLNNDSLIINGQLKPAAVQQRYKDKFVAKEDWTFNFNYRKTL